jgi:hypothetical protein
MGFRVCLWATDKKFWKDFDVIWCVYYILCILLMHCQLIFYFFFIKSNFDEKVFICKFYILSIYDFTILTFYMIWYSLIFFLYFIFFMEMSNSLLVLYLTFYDFFVKKRKMKSQDVKKYFEWKSKFCVKDVSLFFFSIGW